MNLLNINLIRKKSQEFYKIIPEFYQSAPCMIVKRTLVLITNRRRGSLQLTRSANLPRFVLRLLFQFLQLFSPSLFFAFVSRRNSVLLNNSYIFVAKRVTDTVAYRSKKDEPLARLFLGATDRTRKERSVGIAIVRTCKLLFFYMQKSAIASPINCRYDK